MPNQVVDGEAHPTDRREGESIPPTRVTCPYCNREGITESEVNMCRCGSWFAVE